MKKKKIEAYEGRDDLRWKIVPSGLGGGFLRVYLQKRGWRWQNVAWSVAHGPEEIADTKRRVASDAKTELAAMEYFRS